MWATQDSRTRSRVLQLKMRWPSRQDASQHFFFLLWKKRGWFVPRKQQWLPSYAARTLSSTNTKINAVQGKSQTDLPHERERLIIMYHQCQQQPGLPRVTNDEPINYLVSYRPFTNLSGLACLSVSTEEKIARSDKLTHTQAAIVSLHQGDAAKLLHSGAKLAGKFVNDLLFAGNPNVFVTATQTKLRPTQARSGFGYARTIPDGALKVSSRAFKLKGSRAFQESLK